MSAPKKTNQCSRCKNSDFEVDVDGNVSCSHCGLVNQEMKFDNNVVFGEQRQMVGKNINTRGIMVFTQKSKINIRAKKG